MPQSIIIINDLLCHNWKLNYFQMKNKINFLEEKCFFMEPNLLTTVTHNFDSSFHWIFLKRKKHRCSQQRSWLNKKTRNVFLWTTLRSDWSDMRGRFHQQLLRAFLASTRWEAFSDAQCLVNSKQIWQKVRQFKLKIWSFNNWWNCNGNFLPNAVRL